MESKGKTFRRLLQDEPYLFTGGIYSPLDAQIAEQAGMKSIYLSGYSLAMLNGWPDMGFLTMTEVTKAASMGPARSRCRSSRTPTTATATRSRRCGRCRSS
jgi:2-methylisocitrate lyase-like PEP mutase family enzyme